MSEQQQTSFREVQRFSLWLRITLAFFAVFMICLCIFVLRDIASKKGSVGMPTTDFFIIIIITIPIAVSILFLMLKLETEVCSDGLHVRFFPLHLHFKKLSFDDISEYFSRTYKPILEYGGWGIRCGFGKSGKAYNVKGNKGLQLVFKDGKRLLIGSQKPERLVEAINSIKQRSE